MSRVGRAAVVATTGGRRGVARRHLPPRTRRAIGSGPVGHPLAFSGAVFQQKQLSWYMLWFQFPAWPKVGSRRTTGNSFATGRTTAPLVGVTITWSVRSATSHDREIECRFQLVSANISPDTFAGNGRGIDLPPVTCPVMGVWSSGDMALSEVQMSGSDSSSRGRGDTNASRVPITGSGLRQRATQLAARGLLTV